MPGTKTRRTPAARKATPAARRRPPQEAHATGRRTVGTRAEADLQAFLDRFTAALTAGNGKAAAACFEYPAIMVMADAQRYGANQVLADEETVAQFFDEAPQQYHERGVEETFPDIQGVEWVANDLALVRTRFPYIDEDGNDMGDGETSLYVVRRTGDRMAICAAVGLGTDSGEAA